MRPSFRRTFCREATEATSCRIIGGTDAGDAAGWVDGAVGAGDTELVAYGQGESGSGAAAPGGTEPGGQEAGPGAGSTGRSNGGRGDWLKSKSSTRLPSPGASSRTSGRESGRPSVLGFRRRPVRKSSSMNFK